MSYIADTRASGEEDTVFGLVIVVVFFTCLGCFNFEDFLVLNFF